MWLELQGQCLCLLMEAGAKAIASTSFDTAAEFSQCALRLLHALVLQRDRELHVVGKKAEDSEPKLQHRNAPPVEAVFEFLLSPAGLVRVFGSDPAATSGPSVTIEEVSSTNFDITRLRRAVAKSRAADMFPMPVDCMYALFMQVRATPRSSRAEHSSYSHAECAVCLLLE